MELSNLYHRSAVSFPIWGDLEGLYYYIDDQRIASKIGTGFLYEHGYNSCDLMHNITDFDPSYLDKRRDWQHDIMKEELEDVINPHCK